MTTLPATPSSRPARSVAAASQSFARHPQYLLVSDETGLASLEAAIAALPLCAAGRIFIEVENAADVSVITAPSRMSVTWLVRAHRSGDTGSGLACARGQAAGRAVAAWCSEMLPCSGDDAAGVPRGNGADAAPSRAASDTAITLSSVWLGGEYRTVAAAYEALVEEGPVDPELVDAPADFRLGRR
ncbi:MAG: SIP domain-containing protein [Mycetocola sp.]